MVLLNLGYAVMLSVFILVEWKFFTPILNYVVLFFGVFVGIHAIFDTYTPKRFSDPTRTPATSSALVVCQDALASNGQF